MAARDEGAALLEFCLVLPLLLIFFLGPIGLHFARDGKPNAPFFQLTLRQGQP